jgi:hypothetical protein
MQQINTNQDLKNVDMRLFEKETPKRQVSC